MNMIKLIIGKAVFKLLKRLEAKVLSPEVTEYATEYHSERITSTKAAPYNPVCTTQSGI
jgi:hypothetical protein